MLKRKGGVCHLFKFLKNKYFIWLIKLDDEGETEWEITSDGDYEEALFVQQTNDNGYITAGEKKDSGPADHDML